MTILISNLINVSPQIFNFKDTKKHFLSDEHQVLKQKFRSKLKVHKLYLILIYFRTKFLYSTRLLILIVPTLDNNILNYFFNKKCLKFFKSLHSFCNKALFLFFSKKILQLIFY